MRYEHVRTRNAYTIKKGHIPWNKGIKGSGGRSGEKGKQGYQPRAVRWMNYDGTVKHRYAGSRSRRLVMENFCAAAQSWSMRMNMWAGLTIVTGRRRAATSMDGCSKGTITMPRTGRCQQRRVPVSWKLDASSAKGCVRILTANGEKDIR